MADELNDEWEMKEEKEEEVEENDEMDEMEEVVEEPYVPAPAVPACPRTSSGEACCQGRHLEHLGTNPDNFFFPEELCFQSFSAARLFLGDIPLHRLVPPIKDSG